MEDLSQDFDVLVERADDCGALWAARMLRRITTSKAEPPREWPGTLEEARRLVDTFAGRTAHSDRERLAKVVQYAAAWTWADGFDTAPSVAFARAG